MGAGGRPGKRIHRLRLTVGLVGDGVSVARLAATARQTERVQNEARHPQLVQQVDEVADQENVDEQRQRHCTPQETNSKKREKDASGV